MQKNPLNETPIVSKGSIGERKHGFSIVFFLGSVFILLGIIVLLKLFNVSFVMDHPTINFVIKYGTALGSFLGGFFMIFRKK